MKLQEPHLELDAEDIDLNELISGGIYDYLKNVSTWLMIESCLNYLNFLLYTPLYIANIYNFETCRCYLDLKRGKKLLEVVPPMGEICLRKG